MDILGIYLTEQWKSLLYWEHENLLIGTDKGKIMKFSRDQGNMLPFPESPQICTDFKVANGRPRKKTT